MSIHVGSNEILIDSDGDNKNDNTLDFDLILSNKVIVPPFCQEIVVVRPNQSYMGLGFVRNVK